MVILHIFKYIYFIFLKNHLTTLQLKNEVLRLVNNWRKQNDDFCLEILHLKRLLIFIKLVKCLEKGI
uniref:Uncharacterized protein n=1 Tax=Strongyloides stercoralis TaxID=6248 RepID=A0A0K0EAX2_STRER